MKTFEEQWLEYLQKNKSACLQAGYNAGLSTEKSEKLYNETLEDAKNKLKK